MNLANLKKLKNKSKKRIGRGNAAGGGTTAGRGTKGQNSRSGGGVRPGFEGGQMPLSQRVPKRRGFKSLNEKPVAVNIIKLNAFKDGENVTAQSLAKIGIIKNEKTKTKIVGNGELKKKLTVSVPVSKTAGEIIEKAGGKLTR